MLNLTILSTISSSCQPGPSDLWQQYCVEENGFLGRGGWSKQLRRDKLLKWIYGDSVEWVSGDLPQLILRKFIPTWRAQRCDWTDRVWQATRLIRQHGSSPAEGWEGVWCRGLCGGYGGVRSVKLCHWTRRHAQTKTNRCRCLPPVITARSPPLSLGVSRMPCNPLS